MKVEKIKTISIIVLSVLLAMSIFTQVLFCTLLGINSVEALKRTMLANELLSSMSGLGSDESVDIPSEIPTTNTDVAKPNTGTAETIMNTAGIKITYTGVEYDTFWECYKLKFSIENTSNTDVIINSTEEAVDGYMVDNSIGFYCEVLAGKKAVDYMILYDFDLEPLGISKPTVVEFKMNVTASDDLFNDIANTGTVTINIA